MHLPQTLSSNQYVILRHCSPNLCKWNYLYGNLPFYKIQVNYFMGQDEPFGAMIIPKCILSFKTFLSFINRRLVTNIQLKTSRNSFCPFWCLCQKLSLSPLYFNKTLLHKCSEWSSLVSGPGLNSSLLEAKNPGVFWGSATTFQHPGQNFEWRQLSVGCLRKWGDPDSEMPA